MASIRKRGARWQVMYRSPDQRQRSESFSAKRDADRRKVQIESQLQNGEWFDPTVGKQTSVAELVDLWWRRAGPRLRPTTQMAYESAVGLHIKPRLGRYPVAAVKAATILDWVSDLEADGVGPHVVMRAYQIVGRVFALAVRLGMINTNPVPQGSEERPHAPKAKSPRFLEVEEVERLADVIDPHYRTLVLVCAYAGLRWGEVCGLRVQDVDPLHHLLTVVQQLVEVDGKLTVGPPKTAAAQRVVDLPLFVLPALVAEMAGKAPGDLVFVGPRGAPLRRSNFAARVWQPALRAAGIAPCSTHALRHSYASWLAAEGTPITELAQALGHTRASVTLDVYSHVMPHRRRAAADTLDEMHAEVARVVAIR